MRHKYLSLLLLAVVTGLCVTPLAAQGGAFSDPNADYTFAVPDSPWKMTVKPSATSPTVEYVYGDRIDGAFEVRRITVPRDRLITVMIHQVEEGKLGFCQGFVAGK